MNYSKCSRCGGHTGDPVWSNMETPPSEVRQRYDAMGVVALGGYGMFFDLIPSASEQEFILCKTCATAFAHFMGIDLVDFIYPEKEDFY